MYGVPEANLTFKIDAAQTDIRRRVFTCVDECLCMYKELLVVDRHADDAAILDRRVLDVGRRALVGRTGQLVNEPVLRRLG